MSDQLTSALARELASVVPVALSDEALAVLAARLRPHLGRQSDDDQLLTTAEAAVRAHCTWRPFGARSAPGSCALPVGLDARRGSAPSQSTNGSDGPSARTTKQGPCVEGDSDAPKNETSTRCEPCSRRGPEIADRCRPPWLNRGEAKMEIHKRTLSDGTVRWRVRWRQGGRYRARSFDRKGDAVNFAAELRRRQQLGTLAALDTGRMTLAQYVTGTWAAAYAANLSQKTRIHYAEIYDKHILPELGPLSLRDLTPEVIARWQADRLAAGGGPVAVRHAVKLLGSILQRAFEAGHLQSNPVWAVRKPPLPRRVEVRPLAPITVERMRLASAARDSALISVLAYAGLRPGEALALQWRDVREQTLLVERALSLGEEKDTKTAAHRTVRLLAPRAADLREWRMRSGRPAGQELVFPSRKGGPWASAAYKSWGRRAFRRALQAAGVEQGRPYDLRHSFASLLLHEGRSVIYVARQLGHDARLTLSTYGHVIDELDAQPRIDAEDAIGAARNELQNAARTSLGAA